MHSNSVAFLGVLARLVFVIHTAVHTMPTWLIGGAAMNPMLGDGDGDAGPTEAMDLRHEPPQLSPGSDAWSLLLLNSVSKQAQSM